MVGTRLWQLSGGCPWGSLSLINLHLLSKKRKTNVERSTHALSCYMVYSTQDGLVTSPGTIGTCFIWPVPLLFLAALYFLWHVAWKTLWLKVSRDELLSYQERKRRSYLCTIDSQWCNEFCGSWQNLESFKLSDVKPKLLIWPITTDALNKSEFANSAWKSCDFLLIGWENAASSIMPVTEWSKGTINKQQQLTVFYH